MRRLYRSLTLAATFGLSLGACADSTAPSREAEAAAPDLKVIVDWMAPDSTSADFTVTPTGGVFQLGPHAIYFPASSICDPAKSSYGVDEWDRPCPALRTPIRIRAEVRKIDGREWVEFSPDLRFVPKRDASKWVWIWMRTDLARERNAQQLLEILWSPGLGQAGVDESLSDPTLRTYVDRQRGVAYRRIKHFSAYQISVGFRDTSRELDDPSGSGAAF